jgi:hypothetical protein
MTKSKKTVIDITGTINVQKDIHTVFNYISDFRLDKNWRKEINETTIADTDTKLNNVVIEYSYLSKKVPNHKAALKCVEYIPNSIIVYQSLPENTFWLKNSRQTEAISNNITKITYQIEFDIAVVKYGLGFALPTFFIKYYTKTIMKKYLHKLKQILEAE